MRETDAAKPPKARSAIMSVTLWPIALLITIVGWLPVASVLLCYAIATPLGCRVDEAAAHPCLIGPVDIGALLAILGVAGWLFLFTFPLAAMSVIFWPLLLARWLYRRTRRHQSVSDYPVLKSLMSSCFHQDHDLMGDSDEAIIGEFALTRPTSQVRQAVIEIDRLLAAPLDGLLGLFEHETGNMNMTIGENDQAARDWLIAARRVLADASIPQRD